MKKYITTILLIIPCLVFSQTQIGSDINGEFGGDYSGNSLSISSDGNIIAIGAPHNDGNGTSSGHVRIFENLSGVWTQIGSDIDGEAASDSFGFTVSLSSDGNTVAVSSIFNDGTGNYFGYVKIYRNQSNSWTQIGSKIESSEPGDRFGISVSLSSDGDIIGIGADYSDANGSQSGKVQIFENLSGVWTQIGNDINGEASEDSSGRSISISSDGRIIAIGAYGNRDNGIFSGHVRIYENLSGIWTQLGDDINGEAIYDRSGYSVSLSSNGYVVAIGAYDNDGNGNHSGHVRIYQNVSGVWTQIGNDINGEDTAANFGLCVSLSSDGKVVGVGTLYGNTSRVFSLESLLLSTNKNILDNLLIYPNPVTQSFKVELNTYKFESLTIYNGLGQPVLESKELQVNVSKLSTGLYYVAVTTTNGVGIKKLMIN